MAQTADILGLTTHTSKGACRSGLMGKSVSEIGECARAHSMPLTGTASAHNSLITCTTLKDQLRSTHRVYYGRPVLCLSIYFQKADLAVADLTITYEREKGVDFTMPFMNLGVTILYTKPTEKDPNLFSFLEPLSLGVWIYMATAYLAVSLLLYALSRYRILAKCNAVTDYRACVQFFDTRANHPVRRYDARALLWFTCTVGRKMAEKSTLVNLCGFTEGFFLLGYPVLKQAPQCIKAASFT